MRSRVTKPSSCGREEFRRRRIILGLSQKELAFKVHINEGYYSLIEAGKAEPSNPILKDICDVLGIENWRDMVRI